MPNLRLSVIGALIFLVAASLLYATDVQTVAIPLYNTGIAGLGGQDANYDIVSAPAGVADGPAMIVAPNGGAGAWAAMDPDCGWIALLADYRQGHPMTFINDPSGWYDFQITFDLSSGSNPATASISGSWAADNSGYIELNGMNTGVALTSEESFRTLTAFSITTGFQPGRNTLDFMVYNMPADLAPGAGGDPVGLAVEMLGTVDPVPEPATLGLCGLAVAAGCFCLRKRRI